MNIATRWQSWAPRIRSVLRIVAAIIFISAGTMKLFGYPPLPAGVTIGLLSEAGVAGILEAVGGTLLLLGLFTRPVAFLVSGEMAVAYFQYHSPEGLWPMLNGGLGAVLYCFIWLYISAAGPGPWSLDARFRKIGV